MDPEEIELQVAAEAALNDFDVYAENMATVGCFVALQTQWRVIAGFGGAVYQGLDYAAVTPLLLRNCGVKRKDEADVFAGLQIMEAAALPVLNAPKEKADG